jgi:uncharacterized membrane protein YhhN
MFIWLILALIPAILEAIAVSKNIQQLEYLAKPAVMICLFLWLDSTTGLQGQALWFGVGLLCSLAGDTLLMFQSDRLFLFGLIAFLLAHIVYIVGFREALSSLTTWSLIPGMFITVSVVWLLRKIASAMRLGGETRLVAPVILYGVIISVMLFAAVSTLFAPAWKTGAALFVSLGALFFCASDLLLAWNKFVSSLRNGRKWNIILYHLGQIGLIIGAVSQFS